MYFRSQAQYTGGGRCNITNAQYDNRILLVNEGEAEKFLHSTFARFSVADTFAFFEEQGLPLAIEPRQRAFPQTRRAKDVTRVMARYLRQNKVEVQTDTLVRSLYMDSDRVVGIDTDHGLVTATSIVLATGGVSHPGTGATGEGLNWLRGIGHTVFPPNPNYENYYGVTVGVQGLGQSGPSVPVSRCFGSCRDGAGWLCSSTASFFCCLIYRHSTSSSSDQAGIRPAWSFFLMFVLKG